VQDEIAKAIAERLRVTLAGGKDDRLVEQATTNIEAYQARQFPQYRALHSDLRFAAILREMDSPRRERGKAVVNSRRRLTQQRGYLLTPASQSKMT
jgi:hypothetical protein